MIFNRVFPPVETGHLKVQVTEVHVDPGSYAISLGAEQVGGGGQQPGYPQ